MKALDRIVLERAQEQVKEVKMGDERYTNGGPCKWEDCKTQVASWNKSGMCTKHSKTYAVRVWRAKHKAWLERGRLGLAPEAP